LFDKNHGFAKGYAKSLPQIEAEYFVLLNSDVEVTPNWIMPVVELMDKDKSVAACMPKIRSYNNRDYFEYAGAAGGYIDKYGYPFCRGRILNSIEKDNGQYDTTAEIFWASGACMFVRASAYKEAGGLDSDFFAHMEEIDLCWRLKRLGYKIIYCPGSIVFHVGGGTLPNNNPKKIFLNYRNNLFLLYKNLPANKLIKIISIRIILDIISSFIYLFKPSISFTFAVFRAHLSFFCSVNRLRKKRKDLLKTIKVNDGKHIYRKSILSMFFFKQINNFHQLDMKQ
jgi:GT2 family glycosyltransferase